jgi:hypothetical protein
MRCSHWSGCNRSFVLRKHPDAYRRYPKCRYCKCARVYYVSKSVRRYRRMCGLCFCRAYPFPHRPGSLRMCDSHREARREPKRAEVARYMSVLHTRRGT